MTKDVSKMEGKIISRRPKQFDGLTWLNLNLIFTTDTPPG